MLPRNSTNVYDIKSSSTQNLFTISYFFCLCKHDKVTAVTYLLKYYKLEIIDTLISLILTLVYFTLHRLQILIVFNQTQEQRQTIIFSFSLSLFLILCKFAMINSNRTAIKNTLYTDNLARKDSFSKFVTFAMLLIMIYFIYATIREGQKVFNQRLTEDTEQKKNTAKKLGLLLFSSSGLLTL